MGAAQDQMYRFAGGCPGYLDDLFNCRMTAPDDENDTVRGVDRQRDFPHFQVNTPGPVQHNEIETGDNLGGFGDRGEIARWPRTAKMKCPGRVSVEISHIRGEGLVAPVKSTRQGRAKRAEVFLRNIDVHLWIDVQKMVQAARMIAMAVGYDGEVELC